MNPLLHLIHFSSKNNQSFSLLIDVQQIYLRNTMFFFTGLSMIRTLFGPTIYCQNDVLAQEFVDMLCLVNGTMTVGADSTVYHDYYQWVSVYLLLLGFAFYLPYLVWSKRYGRYIRHLESLADKPDEAIRIVRVSNGNFIFFKTLALEVFYAFYLVLLLGATDVFFNHLWSQFKWSWKAIGVIFPNNGSCFFEYNHGSGSSTARFNCLLPLCSVYRKVFFAMYVIIAALIAMNIAIILYHIILLVLKRGNVNAWWAIKIVGECTTVWYAKEKLTIGEKLNEPIIETPV